MNERIFYIDQDADLSEIISALKNTKADTIVFVLPRKSIMFESIVNFQILRSEAEERKKEIVIISPYKKGLEMCETVGVEAHDTIEHWEKKMPSNAIEAQKNTEEDFSHTSQIRRVPIIVETEDTEEKEPEKEPLHWRDLIAKPSWQALAVLLAFSLGLFFFLTVLAFPGATIEIRPEKKGLEIITNVRLVNSERVENPATLKAESSVQGFPIESVFEKEIEFSTITKEFRGENAGGEVTIYNLFPEEQRLRPTTRFQTDTGIIFRITDWVLVPAASLDTAGDVVPGERAVAIVADEQDIYGEFVGERGNLTPRRFFLPGLELSARDTLWAESEKPFTGGFTDWVPRVTQADVDAAQNKIESELLESAEQEITTFVQEKNAREQKDLTLLLGDEFIEKTVIDMVIEDDILGTEKESFRVSAKLKVRTWAYSQGELYDLLWDEFKAKTDRRMNLVAIDINTNSPELLEQNEANGTLKISIAARGAQEFLIDPRSEAGILFVNEVKEHILGQSLKETENILANREEVSEVYISVWPFWSRSMPTLPENISIKVLPEEVLE